MTDPAAAFPFKVKNVIADDDPDNPVLTVVVDVSCEMPGGLRMPATVRLLIAHPTDAQRAAFKAGAAVVLTLAPAGAA